MFVSIFGQIGSGKTTFSKMLKQHLNFPPVPLPIRLWEIGSFAKPGKQFVANVMGVDLDFIEKWKNNPVPPPGWRKPVRIVLQEAISYWRSVDPSIWTRRATERAQFIVFDDARFRDELDATHDARGVAVLILRDGTTVPPDHESEKLAYRMAQNFDAFTHLVRFVVTNDGSLDALNSVAAMVAHSILSEFVDRGILPTRTRNV